MSAARAPLARLLSGCPGRLPRLLQVAHLPRRAAVRGGWQNLIFLALLEEKSTSLARTTVPSGGH